MCFHSLSHHKKTARFCHQCEGPLRTEMLEWENINKILKRHGCAAVSVFPRDRLAGGVVLDPRASLELRTAIKSLVEDTERRQNLIHGLIQSNNQLKNDVRMQQDRAGRQEQRADDLQNILESVKAKIRDLEDDFLCKLRQQKSEVTSLLKAKEAAHENCQEHKEKLREQDQSIAQLRKRLSQAAAAEEKRLENRRKTFLRLVKRQPQENNPFDQQILDLIDGYENRVKQLQDEIRKFESTEAPVLESSQSGGSLDLDTTPNYKALLKSYQEQIQDARRREEQLLRENVRLREELEARPSVREFRVYKQQMRKMEKILLQNNIRWRGATRENKEAEPHRAEVSALKSLPDDECQRHLQDVCRALGVQDVKDLLPVIASKCKEAKTCSKLHKILSEISAVLCGPRAPPLLYKHSSRLQEHGGPDAKTESDFLHLLPTIELWAGQLLSLQALHRSLLKLSQKLQSNQKDRTMEAPGGVRVDELLLLVDTMVEDVESQSSSVSPHMLQALISHFQKLFDVPSMSGIYPRMNEVYSKLGEMNNAMKNLRCLLGLDDTASAGTVVNAVGRLNRELEEGGGHRLQGILGMLDIDSIVNKVQEHEEFFPAFEELIKNLLDVLEISYLEEILPEIQRLKDLEE
ncbi:centrosomal protein of 70 kDa isoform X2 [Eleutherodactylus coqui]|uniref:centrosomal protein of 70 kDa isoform X2 n=1 Tax=Eleutherodactylus coqui TaxID=57060 RepID=UPI003461C822